MVDQIPVAQVIRRFRDLDMPLDRIRAVLETSDLAVRNRLIAEHLDVLMDNLEKTQPAIASLRDLLECPALLGDGEIVVRRVEATLAAAISETIDLEDVCTWYQGRSASCTARWRLRASPTSAIPVALTTTASLPMGEGRRPFLFPASVRSAGPGGWWPRLSRRPSRG
jgi:DNA-binding transcriptional MerR regulator